jgi:hypothetical protein
VRGDRPAKTNLDFSGDLLSYYQASSGEHVAGREDSILRSSMMLNPVLEAGLVSRNSRLACLITSP